MNKLLKLREITQEDWEILLEWRNDIVTRQNSFNSDLISISEHKDYINKTIINPNRTQFILEYNQNPVGTIREDKLGDDEIELSYTVSPHCRGRKIGQIMMGIYLMERSGSFLCGVKEENIPSIKMIEKLGFKFFKKEGGVNFYRLVKSN